MATLPVSDTRKNTVTLGSSTAGPINVGFRLFSEDIRVFVDDAETTAFTLTATFEDGYEDDATITFDSAQDAGAKIDIISDYDPERAADYLASDRQLASKLNSELGHLWGLVADLKRDVARASLVPVDAPELNLAIPNPTESATLIGRADGKGWKTGPTADEISGAQGYATSASDSADEAASSASEAAGYLNRDVRTKSANFTVATSERADVYLVTDTATASLPAAATAGNGFWFMLIADGADVTIDPDGSEKINGSATLTVSDGTSVDVFCDGTGWRTDLPITGAEREKLAEAVTDSDLTTSATDGTSGRVPKFFSSGGIFGLGPSQPPAQSDFQATDKYSGWSRTISSTPNIDQKPGSSFGMSLVMRYDSSAYREIFGDVVDGDLYHRTYRSASGGFFDPRMFYDSGNISEIDATDQQIFKVDGTEYARIDSDGLDVDGDVKAAAIIGKFGVKWHGAAVNGSTDDRTAFSEALDHAIANEGPVELPAGDMVIGSRVNKTLASKVRGVGIVGAGVGASNVIIPDTNTNGFLLVDARISRGNEFFFRDFSVFTQGNTDVGIRVRQKGGGNQHHRTIICENVSIRGENGTSDHFDAPFDFEGAWRPYLRNCIYDGPWIGVDDSNGSARFFTATAFGLKDAYSPFVTDCRAWGCSTGIKSDVYEGSITGIANNGDGTVRATTSTDHPFSTGFEVTIIGTTDYNDTYTVTRVSDTEFDFTETFTSSQTGTCGNAEGPEGGWFLNNIVNGCKNGIVWERLNSTREPLAYFNGNHINYRERGIQVKGGKLIYVQQNVIYNEDSDDTFVATPADIDLANADTFIVTDNILHFSGHSSRRGVQVVGASGDQGTDGFIDRNIFSGDFASAVWMNADTGNITGSNLFTGTITTNVTDNGTGNSVS